MERLFITPRQSDISGLSFSVDYNFWSDYRIIPHLSQIAFFS